jgi:CRISPR-associated protein Cas1
MSTLDTAFEPADSLARRFLIVERFGAFIGKHSERLRVSVKGELVQETPLLDLEHVLVCSSGVSLSADALRLCADRGIPVSFVTGRGEPYAMLFSPALTATILTRRQQLLAAEDPRGVALAQAFAIAKLKNQAGFLRYCARSRQDAQPELARDLRAAAIEIEVAIDKIAALRAPRIRDVRQQLLGYEAAGAKHYWEMAGRLLPAWTAWPGRAGRGATDLVNSCLNYCYGILYTQVERALILAGLDPYAGYLHEDRPGKPSLTLDLIEEFRQPVVDRRVFALLNLGVALRLDEQGRLDEPSRRRLAEEVLRQLDEERRHGRYRRRLRSIIQTQARAIAAFLRGEHAAYTGYVERW